MSETSVTNIPKPKSAPRGRTAAAAHLVGGRWRVLIGEVGQRVSISEARSFGESELGALRALLAEKKVSQLAVVVPASRTIGRIVQVPEGLAVEMSSAAELIAEAELPARLPAHRRGAAVLDLPAAAGQRAAMIVGWHGEFSAPDFGVESVAWLPEPAALAMLVNGAGMAVRCDRDDNAVAVLACGPGRSVLRTLRENLNQHAGAEAAERSAREAAEVAGLPPEFTASVSAERELWLDAESLQRLAPRASGARVDSAWIGEFGVALGALLALAAERSMGGVLSMSADVPKLRISPVQRAVMALSRPRVAYGIIAAAALLIIFAPLGMAMARHGILTTKAGGLSEQQERERELNQQLELYKELNKRRWPVSKLLADLAGSMPQGVEVTSVTFDAEKNAVAIQGSADRSELADTLRAKLNASGVYAGFSGSQQTDDEDEGRVAFAYTGRVASPFSTAKGVEDFAKESLSKRLYGVDAPESSGASAAADEPSSAGSRNGGTSGGGREPTRSAGRSAPKKVEIPAALSDDDINAMDRSAAMKAWSERKKIAAQPGVESADKDRLKAEVEKLRARMDATKSQAAPAGGASGGGGG